jgi:raffinose/stachyose/melibiose transport system substrate-binding protein
LRPISLHGIFKLKRFNYKLNRINIRGGKSFVDTSSLCKGAKMIGLTRNRWVGLSAFVVGGFLLSSCAAAADSASRESENDSAEVAINTSGTLRIVGTTDTQTAIEALIEAFSAEYPDVEVLTAFSPTDAYQSNTPRALAGADGPDLAIVFPGVGGPMNARTLLSDGLLADQSDAEWVDSIAPAGLPLVSADGVIAMNPFGYDTIGVIYNQDIFDEQGIAPVSTFSELLTMCRDLRSQGIQPMSYGVSSDFVTQFINYALAASAVYLETPNFDELANSGETTFSDSGWADVVQKNLEMQDAGCFADGFTGSNYDQMIADVASGAVAMTVTVGPSFPAIDAAAPDGNFAMFPLPAYDDEARNGAPAAFSVGIAISANSSKPELARLFADFANQPEIAAVFAQNLGVLPFDPNADVNPRFADQVELISTGRTGPFANQLWPNPETNAAQMKGMQELFTGQNDVAGVLAGMDATLGG